MLEAAPPRSCPLEAIVQLLDDHHIAVLSEDCAAFADRLAATLAGVPESEVMVMPPGAVDLPGFCHSLEAMMQTKKRIEPEISEIVHALRRRHPQSKHSYVIWPDAEEMLENDVDLFGRLVNALLATAAEREFISPDVLVLQRVIFLGGDKLGAYAECEHGQFNTWRTDDDASTFWKVAACLDRPPVLTFRLDG